MKNLSDKPGERVEIDTQNDATLVGRFFDSASNKGIIMLPGITEHKSSLYSFAKQLNGKGFKVWAFDLNSQGESTGNWDISQMQGSVEYLQRNLKKRHGLKRIGAFGNSSGGMAVGLAASRKDSDLECLCLTSTPSSVDSVTSKTLLKLAKHIPQGLVRAGAICLDKLQVDLLKNENYKSNSHPTFKTQEGYQPYAQIGALKIPNFRGFVESVLAAPKLSEHAQDIHQPVLLVYGGNDDVIGIRSSRLPANIQALYDSIGSKEKRLIVVPGANHALNEGKMIMDECLNQDPEYSWVKPEVNDHFCKYLL